MYMYASKPDQGQDLLLSMQAAGVARIVNYVRNCPLDTLWQFLLELLRDNGSLAAPFRM